MLNLIFRNGSTDISGFGIDKGSLRRIDRHRLRHLADFELHIDRIGLLGDDVKIVEHLGLESVFLDNELEAAGGRALKL